MIEKAEKVQGLYDTKRILEAEIEQVTATDILPRRKAIASIDDALAFLCSGEPIVAPKKLDKKESSAPETAPKKKRHPSAGVPKSRSIPEEEIEKVLWEILSSIPASTVRLAEQVAGHFGVRGDTSAFKHKVCVILGSMPNVEQVDSGKGPGLGFFWKRKG